MPLAKNIAICYTNHNGQHVFVNCFISLPSFLRIVGLVEDYSHIPKDKPFCNSVSVKFSPEAVGQTLELFICEK
jgi:hypothetical protein